METNPAPRFGRGSQFPKQSGNGFKRMLLGGDKFMHLRHPPQG